MQFLNKKHTATITTKKLKAKKYAFNEKLREAIFPRGTEVIGESAFYDCRNLKKAVLPASLKIIEEDAFSLCESLEEVNFPENLEGIGERSFFWAGIKTLVTPKDIKEITAYSFANCRKLQTVTINDGCTKICDGAFSNCMELTEISIPHTVTSLGKECFKNCSELKTIILPDKIKVLPSNAFENCKTLETVVLPENLEVIEENCFSGCTNLKNIILPHSLKSIGTKAFYRCEKLENISLPKNLQTLGERSFSGCVNLRPLKIENNLIYSGAALSDNGTQNTPANIETMFSTSFLPKSDYKLCPTITVPENTKNLRLGFKGLLPYSYLTKNKTCFSHIITLKKYNVKVFIGENYYDEKLKILDNGIFDFYGYDALFDKAQDNEKPIIAVFRLTYPVDLSEKYRRIYEREIIENGKTAAIFAIKTNEENLLQYLIDNADFDTSFCEELYFAVSEQGLPNLLKILSNKRHNTGLTEINSLFEELML